MVGFFQPSSKNSFNKINALYYSKKLGIAFQLTNMLRDIKEDYNYNLG